MLRSAAIARLAAESGPVTVSPWTAIAGLRLNTPTQINVELRRGTERHNISLMPPIGVASHATAVLGGHVLVFDRGDVHEFAVPRAQIGEGEVSTASGTIVSPMPGRIIAVAVKAGDKVTKGQPLVTVEAMKHGTHTICAFCRERGRPAGEGKVIPSLKVPLW